MVIETRAPGVVLLTIDGVDIGDLGDRPFAVLEAHLGDGGGVELFVDAAKARGPSIEVSNEWALWLSRHRDRFLHLSMLTASHFVQLTADFVRRYAELGDVMRIYTDPAVFRGALSNAEGNAQRRA